MKLLSCALLLLLLGLSSALAYKSYHGYQVLQTAPVTAEVLGQLSKMESDPRFNFWTRPSVGVDTLVMTSPEHVAALRSALTALGLAPSTYISDVGPTVDSERAEIEAIRRSKSLAPKAVTFDNFMTFDEIMAYQHEVVAANPSIASIVNLGSSTEGRPMHAIKLASGNPGKKAVWMDCGIHAREWAAPPICLKTIEEIIASPELQNLVDWYILPVANPDGYSFSWTDDRFWRKTRRANAGSTCVGTDPNRNFDFLWNENNNGDFCAEDYPGTSAFSEPECAGIGNFIKPMAESGELIIYFAIHSYGRLMLYPYGHTNVPVPNQPELQAAGDEANAIIAAYRGTVYDVGPSGASLYYTWGASDDYAYSLGVPYSYTFELPRGGLGGFNPAPSTILSVVTETWPGILSLVRRAHAAAALA